jgi:hypothetical protein
MWRHLEQPQGEGPSSHPATSQDKPLNLTTTDQALVKSFQNLIFPFKKAKFDLMLTMIFES